LRYLQASLLVPLYRLGNVGCRALPIRFEEVSRVKKPSRKASQEAWKEYKKMTKLYNLSQRFVQTMGQLRQQLGAAGGQDKILVLAGDGSFCNRTCLRAPRERTQLIARARKDAGLCFRAPQDSRRFYDTPKFTPEQVRQDESRPWKQTKIFYGGKRRKIRYKDLAGVRWRRGGGRLPLRLLSRGSHPLSQTQKQQTLLPSACLSVDDRSKKLCPTTAADLFRPLADRG